MSHENMKGYGMDAAALADMIQGLGEQHTIGCSSLEDDGSKCDCALPAAAAFLGLLRDKLADVESRAARWASDADELRHAVGHVLGCDRGTKLCVSCKRLLTTAVKHR